MSSAHPASEPCPICPTSQIHRVHEQIDEFEVRRSLRRDKRVEARMHPIFIAARKSKPRLQLTVDQAEALAWRLQQDVERELRDE